MYRIKTCVFMFWYENMLYGLRSKIQNDIDIYYPKQPLQGDIIRG